MSNYIVATWGTFDGKLHPGHMHFLESCKQLGDITVFLLDDGGVRRQKNREPIFLQAIRKENLLKTGLVTQVIEGEPDQDANIESTLRLSPAFYCFSEDQTSPWNQKLEKKLRGAGVKVLRLSRYMPERYSTTLLYFNKNS